MQMTIGDITVHRLGFGAMRLTGAPAHPSRAEGVALARRAVELGAQFIDTADAYDLGQNEELLAEALHPYDDGVLIATKGGQAHPGDDWVPLGRPEYLRQQAEISLRRLRLDRIDLYQLHRVDPTVPLADQAGALARLREEGKVRHVGLSEVSVAQIERFREIVPVVSVQNRYGLFDRGSEDVLAYCAAHGIAFVPWAPVRGATRADTGPLRAAAARLGATPTQVALAWLLRHSPVVVPIPGTASRAHLEENMAAAGLDLSDGEVTALDALA
jgi:pyridoxine 4-dehydrogenase